MIKNFFKDKNRVLIISLVAAVALSVVGYAMNVDKFTDYKPPDSLYIVWGDYFTDSLQNTYKQDNAITSWPTWSAAYPHRAIFYGARPVSGSSQGHNTHAFVVYSKKPITDIFTFEYIEGAKGAYQTGRIRALYEKSSTGIDKDIRIVDHSWVGVSSGAIDFGFPSSWGTYVYGTNTVGSKAYFEFDFYYKCANHHQQNAYNVDINGLKSISGVPYAYILECDQHGKPAGSESGSSASEGSSSSGSSSSGGTGGVHWENNGKGDGGRHAWGGGSYGGGLDSSELSSVYDGGQYPERSELEFSAPDNWTSSTVDDYSGGLNSEYQPEFEPYKPAEGDTGDNGSSWSLPSFDWLNDGLTGRIKGDKQIIPSGEFGLVDVLNP